jgi:hypothetical protein
METKRKYDNQRLVIEINLNDRDENMYILEMVNAGKKEGVVMLSLPNRKCLTGEGKRLDQEGTRFYNKYKQAFGKVTVHFIRNGSNEFESFDDYLDDLLSMSNY